MNRQKLAGVKPRSNNGIYFMFVLPAIILYTVFMIFPVLIGFFYSLTDWNGLGKQFNFIGFDNYANMFADERMLDSVSFTLRYTFFLVIGILFLSLLLALCLNKALKGKNFFRSIFFFPAVLSPVIVGLMWNEILYRVGPIIGQALNIELLKQNVLSNPQTAQFGILVVDLWQQLAIPTVLFIAGLQVIPSELYESATMDGATAWQKFKAITLPFLMPIVNIVLVLAVKSGVTLFDLVMSMTSGGPGRATESIGLLIYRNAFKENNFSFGVAQSVVLFVFIGAVSILQFTVLGKKAVDEQ